MHKLRRLLGLSLLEIASGDKLGEVIDVYVDIDKALLVGLVITRSILDKNSSILLKDISAIGRDAVMVRNRRLVNEDQTFTFLKNVVSVQQLFTKTIITETGVELGTLVDIIFDQATGELKEYEISESLISDLLYGRLIMPLPHVQVLGHESVIVPESMLKLIHENSIR